MITTWGRAFATASTAGPTSVLVVPGVVATIAGSSLAAVIDLMNAASTD